MTAVELADRTVNRRSTRGLFPVLVDMMDLLTNMFTELVSCDLSLFEDLFGVVKDLYENAILPLGIAILLLILVWQLFKTMFGRGGVTAEDPVELVCRSCICLFL